MVRTPRRKPQGRGTRFETASREKLGTKRPSNDLGRTFCGGSRVMRCRTTRKALDRDRIAFGSVPLRTQQLRPLCPRGRPFSSLCLPWRLQLTKCRLCRPTVRSAKVRGRAISNTCARPRESCSERVGPLPLSKAVNNVVRGEMRDLHLFTMKLSFCQKIQMFGMQHFLGALS